MKQGFFNLADVILGWSCIPCWHVVTPQKLELHTKYMFILNFAKTNRLEVICLPLPISLFKNLMTHLRSYFLVYCGF